MTKVLKPGEVCDKKDCPYRNVNTPQASEQCWGLKPERDSFFHCMYYYEVEYYVEKNS
jgi:hypothetical protein